MKRVIAVAVVAVLVVGSSAVGQVNLQYQNWNLGLINGINLTGGESDASTIQGVGTLSLQDLAVGGPNTQTTATQGIGAALFQTGEASTTGAPIVVGQTLSVLGAPVILPGNLGTLAAGQQQTVGLQAGPAMQYQGVAVSGVQSFVKGAGSQADAEGLNLVAFGMGQGAENLNADALQVSVILGGQFSEMNGECNALGTVTTTMTATVQQFQLANTPITAP